LIGWMIFSDLMMIIGDFISINVIIFLDIGWWKKGQRETAKKNGYWGDWNKYNYKIVGKEFREWKKAIEDQFAK
jgi:hypothetical protein